MSTVLKAAGMTSPLATTLPGGGSKFTLGDSPSMAGETLNPGDACYIDSSGRVLRAIMGQANAAAAIPDVQTMSAQGDTNPANYLPGSSFVLGYKGQFTPSQNAATGTAVSNATVQAAMQALTTVGAGNMTVAGTFPNFTFTGAGALAAVELDLIEVDSSLIDTASQQPVILQMAHTTVGQPAGTGSLVEASSRVRGWVQMKYKAGQPVTLFNGIEIAYSDGNLTAGQDLYLSGTVPGGLDTAVFTTGQSPIAFAIDTQRIYALPIR